MKRRLLAAAFAAITSASAAMAAGGDPDPSRFGGPQAPAEPNIKILKSKEITPKAIGVAPTDKAADDITPSRFGEKAADEAYGAYQRGLYKSAYELALPRAEKGDGAAQTLVAELLSRGLGVKRNDDAAAKWYQKAAENDVPVAQFQYALMLLEGKFAKKDEAKARVLMKDAADSGNTMAQFNMAQLYMRDDPGPEGLRKATPYYKMAAELGLADAQYAMSQIAANGDGGVGKNDVEARRWLTLAARQGFDTAQLDLGTWLVDGRGGPKDMKSGFEWMLRAARSGNVAAMNRLAKLYMNGFGVEPNNVEAAAWYYLARREGLNDYQMNDFLAGLSDEQLKTAVERANRLR